METIKEAAIFQGLSDPPISVIKLAQSFNLEKPISILNILELANARANVDSMTQLISSGSPGTKINIAVMGDGFAAGDDQVFYNNKVKDLLLHGVFNNDFFHEQKSAFNIFRVNLISQDSGVSTKEYSLDPMTNKCSENSVLIKTITKNTALGIFYNGCWYRSWLEDGPNTANLISNALDKWVPDHKLVLILLNNPGDGGVGGGGRATLPLGIIWATIAHEFGHGLGDLGDEYCDKLDSYTGEEPRFVNNTINTDRSTLKWNKYIDPNTPVPTGIGKCADYTQGTMPNYWDDNQSVGLFEGAGYCKKGIYRPVIRCRMYSNSPPYCPVCYDQMKSVTNDYIGTGDMHDAKSLYDSPGYVRLKIHVDQGKLSVTDIKYVPGQLITTTKISLGYVYEVLIKDESIAVGFLPDIGILRSFANRGVPGIESEHRITTLSDFNFFVRIPRDRLTNDTLPKTTILLHSVQKLPDQLVRSIPLLKHYGFISTEVGHLTGISMDSLPERVRSQLERTLRET